MYFNDKRDSFPSIFRVTTSQFDPFKEVAICLENSIDWILLSVNRIRVGVIQKLGSGYLLKLLIGYNSPQISTSLTSTLTVAVGAKLS